VAVGAAHELEARERTYNISKYLHDDSVELELPNGSSREAVKLLRPSPYTASIGSRSCA
jgi:hypothetical protein